MKTIATISLLILAFFVLLIAGLQVAEIYGDPSKETAMRAVRESVTFIGAGAWRFGAPLLQLIFVLLLAEWFGQRLSVSLKLQEIGSSLNVQTFIAVVVIGSYCVAVLAGISGVDNLKDIALIVVGFYFGTRATGKSSSSDSIVEPTSKTQTANKAPEPTP